MSENETSGSPQVPDPHKANFVSFMNEFVKESDRAAVVLGAAKMEALLGVLLSKFLLPNTGSNDELLEGDSPLATFSSRIKACHRLGLIDSQFASLLHTFRKLRNTFAHEVAEGSLCSGAARDRVLALAEPFRATKTYRGLVSAAARETSRAEDDPGVVFRAVLAIFYLHLHTISARVHMVNPVTANLIGEEISKRDSEAKDGARS